MKLLGWLILSLGLGKGLDVLFTPSELSVAMVIYIIPLILLGIQREKVMTRKTLELCGHRIKVEWMTHEWMTFWGIRLGESREVERKVEWLPDTELQKLTTETVWLLVQTLPVIWPNVLPRALRRLIS